VAGFIFVFVSTAFVLSAAAQAQDPPRLDDLEEMRRLTSTLELVRTRNATDFVISTPNGIDESRYLKIGGIEEWVTLRGEDRANPVVLLLHGGPGDATNPWGYAGFRTWLKTYTIVQWDREALREPWPKWESLSINAGHRSARPGWCGAG
jgi:hypothetical protein